MARCIILKNSFEHGEPRLLLVPDSIEELLKQAGEKLQCKASKAYFENGVRVDDVSLIRDEDKIFISAGEPFFKSDNSRVKMYKIALLGSGGVGKSCLSLRYVKSTFVDIYDPTIEDAFRHQTCVGTQTCILDILDTAGQEDMQMLRRQWIADRDGFLFVFSIVDKTTFDDLNSFWELVSQVKESLFSSNTGVPLVLVGNKKDIEDQRQVSVADARAMAERFQGTYVEASAKTGEGVTLAFEELVRAFMRLEPEEKDGSAKKKKSLCTLL